MRAVRVFAPHQIQGKVGDGLFAEYQCKAGTAMNLVAGVADAQVKTVMQDVDAFIAGSLALQKAEQDGSSGQEKTFSDLLFCTYRNGFKRFVLLHLSKCTTKSESFGIYARISLKGAYGISVSAILPQSRHHSWFRNFALALT